MSGAVAPLPLVPPPHLPSLTYAGIGVTSLSSHLLHQSIITAITFPFGKKGGGEIMAMMDPHGMVNHHKSLHLNCFPLLEVVLVSWTSLLAAPKCFSVEPFATLCSGTKGSIGAWSSICLLQNWEGKHCFWSATWPFWGPPSSPHFKGEGISQIAMELCQMFTQKWWRGSGSWRCLPTCTCGISPSPPF